MGELKFVVLILVVLVFLLGLMSWWQFSYDLTNDALGCNRRIVPCPYV